MGIKINNNTFGFVVGIYALIYIFLPLTTHFRFMLRSLTCDYTLDLYMLKIKQYHKIN